MALPNEVNPLLQGAAANQGGYQIENSLRFRNGQYLSYTPSSALNGQKWTISFWAKRGNPSQYSVLLGTNNTYPEVYWNAEGTGGQAESLAFSTGTLEQILSVALSKCRDTMGWYHVVWAWDTTQSTASNRSRYWINGVLFPYSEFTYNGAQPGQNASSNTMSQAWVRRIGTQNGSTGNNFDGYLAEWHQTDGTVYEADDFGEFNADGVWVPKEVTGISYGTHGYYLDFSDTSDIGADRSGNGNDWTPTGFNFTSSSNQYDYSLDTPTSNYAQGNPLLGQYNTGSTANNYSQANLTFSMESSTTRTQFFTHAFQPGGKYYVEWTWNQSNVNSGCGLCAGPYTLINEANGIITLNRESTGIWRVRDYYTTYLGYSETVTSQSNTGTIGMTVDTTNWPSFTTQFYGNNGSTLGSSRTNTVIDLKTPLTPYQGGVGGGYFYLNAGQRPFVHTIPTGFKALNSTNLGSVDIKDGEEYFKAVTYSGNNGTQSITTGFQPDLVWIKCRNNARDSKIADSTRGTSTYFVSNSSGQESTHTDMISSFNSTGFTLSGNAADTNASGSNYVAWCWKKASGIMDIVSYSGTSSAQTISHNLGVVPGMILIKCRNATASWQMYHKMLGNQSSIFLDSNSTAVTGDNTRWNSTSPTSTQFTVGTDGGMNQSGRNYIAYLFADIPGYSDFQLYKGNGNSNDGPYVYTGHKPAFVIIKGRNEQSNWILQDNARSLYNPRDVWLAADVNSTETTADVSDFLSNGIKRRNGNHVNSSYEYITISFAEKPFGGSNVAPCPGSP